ncbi:hypothetical protein D3C85_1106410 [compost metagenome]
MSIRFIRDELLEELLLHVRHHFIKLRLHISHERLLARFLLKLRNDFLQRFADFAFIRWLQQVVLHTILHRSACIIKFTESR